MPHIWRTVVGFLCTLEFTNSGVKCLTSNSDLLDRRPISQSHAIKRIRGRDFQARTPSSAPSPCSPTLKELGQMHNRLCVIHCISRFLLVPSSFLFLSSYSLPVPPVDEHFTLPTSSSLILSTRSSYLFSHTQLRLFQTLQHTLI
jgi:hypothetical protein